ncbi:MAG: hypothetical protein LBI05_02280 [Planctomycetaceae bacterium]|jgi:hypothetical protein|nr:hypothetical protein [Planctomycetaceae bacterium]
MNKQDGFQQIAVLLARQNVLLEGMGEIIGKSVARWLIKANLPGKHRELQCTVYLEMGFPPIEIVDLLYPNLGKADRRAKAQAISRQRKK